MSGYERPSAVPTAEAPKDRVAFHGRLEEPNPTQFGRVLVTLSPMFPFERDIRAWAALHVNRGEVRIWRRTWIDGRYRGDTELPLLTIQENET